MQGTRPGNQVWAIAMYLLTTKLKGSSTKKLPRKLDSTQRMDLGTSAPQNFQHPYNRVQHLIEFDETSVDRKTTRKHILKTSKTRCDMFRKVPQIGMRNRHPNNPKDRKLYPTEPESLRFFPYTCHSQTDNVHRRSPYLQRGGESRASDRDSQP